MHTHIAPVSSSTDSADSNDSACPARPDLTAPHPPTASSPAAALTSADRSAFFAATAASRSVRTRVMSAASMATSAPEPMANPSPCVPAWARAAASLTPSPTMPTTAP